jgi:hypothetical protein
MAQIGCPLPSNLNPLSPTGFRLSITKLPEVTYFCQEANIPEISLDPIPVGTPFSTSQVPGEILDFGALTINFIIDENMANYKAIYKWIAGLGFPQDYTQYQNLANSTENNASTFTRFGIHENNYSDGLLEILGSNNIGVQAIQFKDLYPSSIGSLNFQSNVDDIQYLTGTCTFRYTYYSFLENEEI